MQIFILPNHLPGRPQRYWKPTAKADIGSPLRTKEICRRAPPEPSAFPVQSKPNLLWHLGLEIFIPALGNVIFWKINPDGYE